MADVEKGLSTTVLVFNGLFIIGFLGVVWLMIFGNLSGNMGIPRDSFSYLNQNQTITLNDTGDIPAGASFRINPIIGASSVIMTNLTDGIVIGTDNYTLTGVTFFSSTTNFNESLVNVSYVVTFDSTELRNSEDVILNVSEGSTTFFTFSNVLFTITAIVLLITLLLGLLFLVLTIASKVKGGGKFTR